MATDNAIKSVTFSAIVNNVTVRTTVPLTEVSETATSATYNFSFTYNTGGSTTATATGVLTLNKSAGTYTVDLDGPIAGVTINQTGGLADGAFVGYAPNSSTTDNSQPEVSVATLSSDMFVQFTGSKEPSNGPSADGNHTTSSGAADTFTNGELFVNATSWVSTSGAAAGVAGDTMGPDEILNFNLYKTNPTGNLGQTSTQSASSMFLKFDGIGASEDFVVVLKLWADTNGNGIIDAVGDTFTTKAILVQNTDILKGPGTGPGVYSAISLGQNDGLVIIESNDYNEVGQNFQIIGAQILTDPTNVEGTALNLNNAIGASGGGDGIDAGTALDTQLLSDDVNTTAPMKIASIGFIRTTTTAQTAQLTFNVTIQDGDGDELSQTLVATVNQNADSTSAATIPAGSMTTMMVSQESIADNSSSSRLLVSDDQSKSNKTAANTNTFLLGAIAAAGLSSSSLVAAEELAPAEQDSSLGLSGPRRAAARCQPKDRLKAATPRAWRSMAKPSRRLGEQAAGDPSTGSAETADYSLTDNQASAGGCAGRSPAGHRAGGRRARAIDPDQRECRHAVRGNDRGSCRPSRGSMAAPPVPRKSTGSSPRRSKAAAMARASTR